jgi:hypothetical protein
MFGDLVRVVQYWDRERALPSPGLTDPGLPG